MQLIVPRSPAFIRGGVPRIDWSNPITKGLTGFWLFGLGNFAAGSPSATPVVPGKAGPQNLVTGLPSSLLNTSTYSDSFPMQYAASAIGRGVDPKFVTYYWVLGQSADLYGTAASFGITKRMTDLTAQPGNAFGDTAGTSCYLPYSDSNIYWDFPNSVSRVGPFAYTKTNSLESWIFTGGPAGRSVWRNGNRDFNNTTTTTAGNPGSSVFTVNKGTGAGGYSDMEYYVFATWNRQLADLEGQSWTLDPLQFLRWPEDDIFAEWVGVTGAAPAAIAAVFSGAGAFSVNVLPQQFITSLFVGQGSITSSLAIIEQITALFSGASSLVTTALLQAVVTTQLSGIGSMSEGLLALEQIVALFSGAGLLSANVIPEQFISALFAGSGQLTTRLTAQELIVALLSGTSLLSVDLAVAASSTASALLTGSGGLTTSLLAIEQGKVLFSGTGLLSVQEIVLRRIAASFGGTGQLLADIVGMVPQGGSSFSGSGSLTVDTHVYEAITALLSGTGSFNISLLKLGPLEILFTGTGSLTEELRVIALSSALLSGQGGLFTDVGGAPLTGSRFAGVGTLFADLLRRIQKIGVWPRTGIIQADTRRGGFTNIVRKG